MNSTSYNSISGIAPDASANSAEATLRLIARLPVPDGIEDRVIAGLKTAPRTARILVWPAMLRPAGNWMRGAAAAAIVFVVGGGGWGIYTHVVPPQAARVIVMPRAGATGGFSSAGAMRTPQTLNGPVVAAPVTGQSGDGQPVVVKPVEKVPAPIAPMTQSQTRAAAGNKAHAQTSATTAK